MLRYRPAATCCRHVAVDRQWTEFCRCIHRVDAACVIAIIAMSAQSRGAETVHIFEITAVVFSVVVIISRYFEIYVTTTQMRTLLQSS
jgi:hypothetical protein